MKKVLIFCFALWVASGISLGGICSTSCRTLLEVESRNNTELAKDSLSVEHEKADSTTTTQIKKTGFNFMPFPIFSYSSDMGLQYGAFCDIYYFGDGELYPEYLHKLSVEASAYTLGASVFSIFYDSKHLIKGLRTTATLSYIPDAFYSFYGFNGYASPYYREGEAEGVGSNFYALDREHYRFYLDLQGALVGDFSWVGGIAFRGYRLSALSGISEDGSDYAIETLFGQYLSEGIITAEECSGNSLEFKFGALHDTRDRETDPREGFFTEATISGSVDFFNGRGEHYVRGNFMHRGYLPCYGDVLTFAYRLGYQGKLFGSIPFYLMSDMQTLYLNQTLSEGLGGRTSLRGILQNRVIGEGIAWGNLELRFRFLDFRLWGQEFYLGLNPFFDFGQVVVPYKLSAQSVSGNSYLYSGDSESLHCSAGIGGKIIMNQNFVLSMEYGATLDKRDGEGAIYLGLNFIF